MDQAREGPRLRLNGAPRENDGKTHFPPQRFSAVLGGRSVGPYTACGCGIRLEHRESRVRVTRVRIPVAVPRDLALLCGIQFGGGVDGKAHGKNDAPSRARAKDQPMILRSVRVRDFKSITDSGEVVIEDGVTALVGKNESGKTAFLEALYRLNPVETGHPTDFEGLRDFPRNRWFREKDSVPGKVPVAAAFKLDDTDVEAVESKLGAGALPQRVITVEKTYHNDRRWGIPLDEEKIVAGLIERFQAAPDVAKDCKTLEALQERLDDEAEDGPLGELRTEAAALDPQKVARETLRSHLPKFLYFDEYDELPGRVSINDLQETEPDELSPEDHTALSLMTLAGVTPGDFAGDEYEARKAQLEAAGNGITAEVFEYWSQNDRLRVVFDVEFATPEAPPARRDPYLQIRIENLRHGVTLNFDERSRGFQWFFSFLAAFSEYRDQSDPLVLLLDEPGLGLHASAQADLLRYIDERLAPARQVVYTTHSPFLVDPTKIERARVVEDKEGEGTTVSSEVLLSTPETLFPLQAALGYELVQSLFVGPNNLVVEGPADYLYLTLLSSELKAKGREGLDDRWTIVPVGGIDKVPTFIALLGAHLRTVAVLIDGKAGGHQKINDLINEGLIEERRVLPLAKVIGVGEADIEDLFEPAFYVKLVRTSGAANITMAKLKVGNRIVQRITAESGAFDHHQPARHLLEHQTDLLKNLDDDTLDRFERVFGELNKLLET